jgi:hypothetical protein
LAREVAVVALAVVFVLGGAPAGEGRPSPGGDGCAQGSAYGLKWKSDGVVERRPTPTIRMGCGGTGGRLVQKSVASLDDTPIAATGNLTVTLEGVAQDTQETASATASVAAVSLLDGRITADLVTADARAAVNGTTSSTSHDGSGFLNLSVAGHPEITDAVEPGVQVELEGLGTLWLYQVIASGSSFHVMMIEVLVTEENALGIPPNTTIKVASGKVAVS